MFQILKRAYFQGIMIKNSVKNDELVNEIEIKLGIKD